MPADIDQLSAADLLELAKAKLQEEQAEANRTPAAARVAELRKLQQERQSEHQRALAAVDNELLALKRKRDQIVDAFRTELSAIEKELAELAQEGAGKASSTTPPPPTQEEAAPPSPPSAPEAVETPAASIPVIASPKGPTDDDFGRAILEALKGRTDISDSLLKEKLRAKGFPIANLPKQLERLVREGRVINKGGGNFALKKR